MKLTYTVDWLTATYAGTRSIEDMRSMMFGLWYSTKAQHDKASFGYKRAVRTEDDMLCQSGDREDMGTNVIASGSALSAARQRLRTFEQCLSDAMLSARAVSRLDVAFDVYDAPMLRSLISAVNHGDYRCAAKSHAVIESENGGLTLYLGSRQSERMLRIYNRAAILGEHDTQHERIELETKGGTATRLARSVALYGIQDSARAWITDFAAFDNAIWNAALSGTTAEYEASERKLPSGRKWLLDTIAPMVANRMLAGDKDLLDDFIESVKTCYGGAL